MSEWIETTLGNVIELKRGYDLPQQSRSKGSVPLVSSAGITDYHSEAMVKGPGVVTGRYGTLGQVFYIENDFWPLNTTLYVRDFKGNDPRFINYFLRSLDFQAYSDKGAVPGLNRNHLHLAEVSVPSDVNEQRAIAHILGTLDDKIELNRRMNETLEAIARALFKSWFVDFDPVRAKMSGEPPESICQRLGLTPDLLALFPERLVDSELGEIPEVWVITPLPRVIDFMEGPGIRNWQYTEAEDGIKFINIRCIKDGDLQLNTASKITAEEAFGKYKHFQLAEDDIVISISGTLGRFGFVRKSHLPLSLNTSVVRFRPVTGKSTLHFIAGFTETQLQRELEIRASGSAQRNFGPMHLKQIEILLPPYQILQAHSNIANALFRKRQANLNQIDALASIRDGLLTKLLSGELRVPARKMAMEAMA